MIKVAKNQFNQTITDSAMYVQRIAEVDQWWVRRILDIRWHDFVRNADVRRITNQPPPSSIIKSRRLTFFGHLARTDENADASQAIFEPPPENWRRPPGRPRTTWMKNIHDDLSLLDRGIHEAWDLAPNRPLCDIVQQLLLLLLNPQHPIVTKVTDIKSTTNYEEKLWMAYYY